MTFSETVRDLDALPEVQQLRRMHHHRNVNRYDHSVRVALWSFRLARQLGWDARACARAGMLHDLFLYDKYTGKPEGWKGPLVLTHPEDAERLAEHLVELSPMEKNIILSHMWPATRHWPHYREAWLVSMVDKVIAVRDYTTSKKRARRRLVLPRRRTV